MVLHNRDGFALHILAELPTAHRGEIDADLNSAKVFAHHK